MNINNKYLLNEEFDQALRKNDIESFKELILEKDVKVSYEDNFAAYYACEYGFHEIFEKIFKSKRIRVRSLDNEAFVSACNGGYYKIVELFLKKIKIDPTLNNNKAMHSSYLSYFETEEEIKEYGIEEYKKSRKKFDKNIGVNDKNYKKVVDLLWEDKRVRNSLEKSSFTYQQLMPKVIKTKMSNF
jgi:hypothetical protein